LTHEGMGSRIRPRRELMVTTELSPGRKQGVAETRGGGNKGRRRLRWKQAAAELPAELATKLEEEKGALPAELATKFERQLATPSAMCLVVAQERQALPEVVERDSEICPADAELEQIVLEGPSPTVSQLEAELEQMLETPSAPPADDTDDDDDDDDAESEDSEITLKWGAPRKVPRAASGAHEGHEGRCSAPPSRPFVPPPSPRSRAGATGGSVSVA